MMVNVRNEGEISDTFSIINGIKQGCGLVPTLFSIFPLAMIEEAYKNMGDIVYINSRQNPVSHFRAKTKTQNILMRELLVADDSAQIDHSAEVIHRIVDAFVTASSKCGMKINIKNTVVVFQSNCTMTREDVNHLFACPGHPTTLIPSDLWNRSRDSIRET